MTREQAEYIKQLRCSGCTYRAIARHYARKYPDASEIHDNQLDGEWLVVEAALILVESDKAWDDAGKESVGYDIETTDKILLQFTRELMGVSVAHMTDRDLDAFMAPFRRLADLGIAEDPGMPLWLQKRINEQRIRLLTVLARRP